MILGSDELPIYPLAESCLTDLQKIKMDRNVYAPLGAFFSQKAHKHYGKAFKDLKWLLRYVLNLKGQCNSNLRKYKVKVFLAC